MSPPAKPVQLRAEIHPGPPPHAVVSSDVLAVLIEEFRGDPFDLPVDTGAIPGFSGLDIYENTCPCEEATCSNT